MEKFNWQHVLALSIAVICLVLIYAIIFTFPVWYLWNDLIPEITKGRISEITFLQALKINLLFGFCFRIWFPYQKNNVKN